MARCASPSLPVPSQCPPSAVVPSLCPLPSSLCSVEAPNSTHYVSTYSITCIPLGLMGVKHCNPDSGYIPVRSGEPRGGTNLYRRSQSLVHSLTHSLTHTPTESVNQPDSQSVIHKIPHRPTHRPTHRPRCPRLVVPSLTRPLNGESWTLSLCLGLHHSAHRLTERQFGRTQYCTLRNTRCGSLESCKISAVSRSGRRVAGAVVRAAIV